MDVLKKELVKEDRNGTKYYDLIVKCSKCNGSGYIQGFAHVFNGTCFDCNGSGVVRKKDKEYTEEYAKKLKLKREKKQLEKEIAQKNLRIAKSSITNDSFLKYAGFNENGNTLVVVNNSKSNEYLKSLGCKYNSTLGWHVTKQIEELETIEFSSFELCEYVNEFEELDFSPCAYEIVKYKIYKTLGITPSGWIGNVKDKIEFNAECTFITSYDSMYGTQWIHIFKDENNNEFKWVTNGKKCDTGNVTIKGTVKEHSEYNGTKQTVLTRCKLGCDNNG